MRTFIPTGGRMARVIVSLSTVVTLSGVGALVPQMASAVTIAELQAQIAALTAQLNSLIAQQGTPAGKCSFTRDLTVGVTGDDVKCLQQYLNSTATKVASSGVGSAGNESMFFGPLTRSAVAAWQAANGVSPAAGYFGSISRAKYNSLVAGAPAPTPTPPGTPAPVPTGTGLSVAAGTQPGDSLAPKNAARIPATRFTLTAGTDGDVKVNSITVERQGPSADSSVDAVVLLGEDGLQIGLSKKLNSNHQAVLNEPLTIKSGQTRTYTIAINRPSSASDGGDIVKMAVMAVDAGSATVSGALPVVGSPITMNSSLTIGTATLTRGVNDPGTGATKEIGTAGYIFTALRVTAGSAEDVKVKWVSMNQSGSAATTDLKNVKVNFDGTDYPITISADGKYYTANFGDGVTITKGNTKEFYVKGDIESGTNRGIDFDLYRYTDLYVVGSQFGYGLTPTATDSGDSSTDDDGTLQATNPVWDAYEATVGAGSLTVTKSTAVPAQNIAVNLNEQPLGAFDVEVKGEDVNVTSLIVRVSANKNDTSVTEVDYSQVALYDNTTGKVVGGPLDGSGTADAEMIFTFTDSITFPIGKRAYLLKGKLSTDFDSDTLISASTTPNGWTATGAVSGNTITPSPTTAVTGNSYTVKTATSSISLSNEPANQNVVAGTTGFTFAKILFDGTSSGEDVRFTSAQFALETDTGSSNPTNCQLFDGTTALNTGTNVQNPTSDGQKTFTLDKNLVIPKGTLKTVSLKCDVPANLTADDTIEWKINIGATFGATGLTSGNTVTPTLNNGSNANSTDNNNKMTIKSGGTLSIALDGSSPSVRLAQSGQEVVLSVLRITGTNEDINVKQIALQLSNVASNTPQDLSSITLWDGSTKVGEAVLTSLDNATATLSNFTVLKDSSKNLTVKGVIGAIGVNQPARPGHLVTVDWDRDASSDNSNSATYAVGVQSSTNVYASRTAGDTASAGVRIVRAYPTISVLSVPSTSLADAAQKVLYRFSVTPTSGANGVSLFKFTFNIATSGDESSNTSPDFTIQSLRLYAFTGSNFSGGAFSSDGQLNNGTTFFSAEGGNDGVENDRATTTDYAIYFNPANPTNTGANSREAVNVPAGSTYYFELRGDVSGADSGDSATIQLMGDDRWHGFGTAAGVYDDGGFLAGSINYAFATTAPFLDDGSANLRSGGKNTGATGVHADDNQSGDDFIWSGNSTTTHSGGTDNIMGPDWYNGFVVPGLPSSGATAVTLSL